MIKNRVLLRLEDIRIEVERLEALAARTTYRDFESNWLDRRAVERAIEIISEATRHIPDDLKAIAPGIAWRNIAGIGNILRHDYDRVDPARLWSILTKELPPLREAMRSMLAHVKSMGRQE